jgi:tRNA(Ile)-lysidine synthase
MASRKFTDKVIATCRRYSMIKGGEHILVGLSGGPDSVCLLSVLQRVREQFKLRMSALYIDHGLRPGETEKETEFCRNLCSGLSIPFIAKGIGIRSYAKEQKLNIQEAARQLRYRTFDEAALEINARLIALGHTADDQAETLLMRLFRGSGPTGLAGIPPVRNHIIRPLIEVRRKEIEDFLETERIPYIVDSSNLKEDYLRNKIRRSLMPIMQEYNPDIIGTLSKTALIFRDEERYFEILVTKTLMKMISRKTGSRIELFLAPFEIMDKVLMRKVLRRAIDATHGLRGISFIHIEDIIELIKQGKPGDRLFLPKGIRVIKEYATMVLTSDPPAVLSDYSLAVPGETILKEAGVLIKASLADSGEPAAGTDDMALWISQGIFDADRLRLPLQVRPRKDGDCFYPSGFGRKKKLQDFFVDRKIPRDERNRVPLILSGDDIIWVVGYRGDERFRVTEETKNILKLEVKKIRD